MRKSSNLHGYDCYCEELLVEKYKTKYSCESAIYFDLDAGTIKENCEFQYFFNMTDVKPAILDGRQEIVLANRPNNKYVICNDNNNIPIKIPSHSSHTYVLVNRSVLCNCRIEAEDSFLLDLIATCPEKQSHLVMYFTVNTTLCIILTI